MFLDTINKHDRDSYIQFEEEEHKYFLNGKQISISVTGFIHHFFPQFDSDNMASRIALKRCKPETSAKYANMTKEMILEKWKEDGAKASGLGTELHRDIELYFNDINIENDSVEYSYFKNFLKSPHMENLVPFRTEWVIYDEELDLAGSIDMIFRNTLTNTYVIYDWKRSKEIKFKNDYKENGFYPLEHVENCNFWHYSLQLNLYRYLLKKNYSLNISSMHLLILHPNNSDFVKIDIDVLDEHIEKMISHRLKSLEDEKN